MSAIQTGDFVHVVATVNTATEEGKILYVNPSNTTIRTDAKPEATVELVVEDENRKPLHREAVVVRRSSCDGEGRGDVGLIQADLPHMARMKAVSLVVNGKETSRYVAGEAPPASANAGMTFGMVPGENAPHRQELTLHEAAALQATPGITYTIQVQPDTDEHWHTIAVGRPTPSIEIDRNQFGGARKAGIRVLRTTGFEEEVIAQDTIDFQ